MAGTGAGCPGLCSLVSTDILPGVQLAESLIANPYIRSAALLPAGLIPAGAVTEGPVRDLRADPESVNSLEPAGLVK